MYPRAPISRELAQNGNNSAYSAKKSDRATMTAPRRCLLVALALLLLQYTLSTDKVSEESTASLFSPEERIFALGPSVFRQPTHLFDNDKVIPVAQPLFGQHRSDKDAVFAYAEGYVVGHYILFLKTLRDTGFDGDVVLAIADDPQEGVVEYLSQQPHTIVYKASLVCWSQDGTTVIPRTVKQASNDVFQMCQLKNVYGTVNEETNTTSTLEDPREGRVVATLRYEWYWIWSLQYSPQSWIMLVDARDTIFQVNPFVVENLPRPSTKGILYFFGENTEATRLGRSRHNSNWLRNAYGQHVVDSLGEKPTICSGSSMGNQRAIETYLKAMVNEWDETTIKMTGSDQGFHNYLYYSGKLQNANNIAQLVVWEQGKGIINNLGALRTKPLSEWGIYNNVTHEIYNWDKNLSPVVHQWDRDQTMFRYTTHKRMKQMVKDWKQSQAEK